MRIKLIASDIDGTIINSQGQITPRTQKVIKRLKDYDIAFTFATGRNHESTLEIAKQLEMGDEEIGMICLNGLQTYDLPSMNKTEQQSLTFEESKRMGLLGSEFYLGIMYCFEDCIYFQMDDKSYKDYTLGMDEEAWKFFNRKLAVKPINSIYDIQDEFKKNKIQKVAYIQAPEYMSLVIDRMKKTIDDDYMLMRVGESWTEVAHKEITKGHAVLDYAAKKGITAEEIMVFGDSENDISMFEIAKVAVAMENAMPTAKEKATDFTLSNNEEGVADYIERYLDTLDKK